MNGLYGNNRKDILFKTIKELFSIYIINNKNDFILFIFLYLKFMLLLNENIINLKLLIIHKMIMTLYIKWKVN